MNTDELALRQMLYDLTAGQPPAPPGRYEAVRRRSVRQRRVQATARSAAVAAAAGIVAVVGAVLPASHGRTVRGLPSIPAWALAWPDHRDGSVPQRVLDGAVDAWRHLHGIDHGTSPLDVRRVIWYVGQTAANGREVVVTFEASTLEGRYLVAGYASAADVMSGQAGWSQARRSTPWVIYDAPSPRRHRGLLIGLNLPVPSAKANSPDDWIMVLAAPDVQEVLWTAPGPSKRTRDIASSSTSVSAETTDHGLAIGNAGQVYGRVQVNSLIVGHHDTLRSATNVGVPGSVTLNASQPSDVPSLAAPAAVAPPQGFEVALGTSGQSSTQMLLRNQIISRRPAVVVRCYGPQPINVFLNARLLGVIRCDNNQHELIARSRTRSSVDVELKTSFLTGWRIDIGSVR